MRVLQIIDSLNPGGAERMALNYFMALKERNISSYLVVTREKGLLSKGIERQSGFYFLHKKAAIDLHALLRLRKIILDNNVNVVHAHGSSWFFAVLCKLAGCDFNLIWHDHYGESQYLHKRPLQPLKFFSNYFDGIICVNQSLKKWALEKLNFYSPLIYLPNFVRYSEHTPKKLKGSGDFKIICVSNFRPQKDHMNLFEAFKILQNEFSVSLHLFGRDFRDSYSNEIKKYIHKEDRIYYYGEVESVLPYLKCADLGVLASRSEGLPLVIIEYGLSALPTVCTDVGECAKVIGSSGKLVPSKAPIQLADAIRFYIQDKNRMSIDARDLNRRIIDLYSEDIVIEQYLQFLNKF